MLRTDRPPQAPSILDKIARAKAQEVAQWQEELSLAALGKQLDSAPPPRDFFKALRQSSRRPSVIAEVKKASPSQGVIAHHFDPVQLARNYERAGASCISVLCDRQFFQGGFEHLRQIRPQVQIPLLCKEFILDRYQIDLARSVGADAVLLIATLLGQSDLQDLLYRVHQLGMNALVEVHTLAELDRVLSLADLRLVGINNRNLHDFSVDLGTTPYLIASRRESLARAGVTIVSESGLQTSADLAFVSEAGAHAVLMGETLVRKAALGDILLP
jgi:indole-3-glycerol phosphate synthase